MNKIIIVFLRFLNHIVKLTPKKLARKNFDRSLYTVFVSL